MDYDKEINSMIEKGFTTITESFSVAYLFSHPLNDYPAMNHSLSSIEKRERIKMIIQLIPEESIEQYYDDVFYLIMLFTGCNQILVIDKTRKTIITDDLMSMSKLFDLTIKKAENSRFIVYLSFTAMIFLNSCLLSDNSRSNVIDSQLKKFIDRYEKKNNVFNGFVDSFRRSSRFNIAQGSLLFLYLTEYFRLRVIGESSEIIEQFVNESQMIKKYYNFHPSTKFNAKLRISTKNDKIFTHIAHLFLMASIGRNQ